VEGAAARLDLGVYEVGPSFAGPLATAAARGIAVRLLLDGHAGANATTARRLAGGGAEVRVWGHHTGAEAHWKLIAADDGTVAVGSGNLIARDAPRDRCGRLPPPAGQAHAGTREWWVIVEGSAALASRVRGVLAAEWETAQGPPASWIRRAPARVPPVGVPRPLVAPLEIEVGEPAVELVTGGAAVATALGVRLGGARRRALCTVPYVHAGVPEVGRLLDGLGHAAARGADTRLLLGAVPDAEDLARLRARGLVVRVMDPARCTTGHAKGAVVDGAVALGSANWSRAGLGANLEAAVVVEDGDAADYYAAAFQRDWAASG